MSAIQTLTYATLPPGSGITRDERPGGVTITAPAQEAGPDVRREVARDVAVSSSAWSAGVLAVVLLVFGATVVEHRRLLPWWAAVLFAVFCVAVFLLVWWARYLAKLAAVERGLRQATVISADARRLLVESTGPLGPRSYAIDRGDIAELGLARVPDGPAVAEGLDVEGLVVALVDGRRVEILCGRRRGELLWIAGTIREVMALPGAPPRT